MSDEEMLQHYGILGMKWGVRRTPAQLTRANGRAGKTESSDDCLNLSANIDQTGRAFLQDIVLSMLDEGCVAIVPVDTDDDPDITGSYKIESMRTGKILEWFPSHVKVRVYNERTGLKEDIVVSKDTIAIIENQIGRASCRERV